MSIAKKFQAKNKDPIALDIDSLTEKLKKECPEILFVYLLGSAVEGTIAPQSDLDLAAFTDRKPTIEIFQNIIDTTEPFARSAEIDLGFLNSNEPVYRFEALKGRLLFTRDREKWLKFYSVTCREYEYWLFHYEKQRRYRMEYGTFSGS